MAAHLGMGELMAMSVLLGDHLHHSHPQGHNSENLLSLDVGCLIIVMAVTSSFQGLRALFSVPALFFYGLRYNKQAVS